VETPVNLTKQQQDLLKQFDAAGKETTARNRKAFSKVRDFWEDLKRVNSFCPLPRRAIFGCPPPGPP
jgi:hypothetical protein